MPKLRRVFLVVLPFCLAIAAAAAQQGQKLTLDESSVRIDNLGPAPAVPQIKGPEAPVQDPGPDPFVIIDQILNLGEKIWSVIQANKPVVNVQTQYATALPQGITSWAQLAGWKPPVGTVYGFSMKNAYGAKVVNVKYQVLRTFGGNYNGKGQFLTAVTIQPISVDVAWGYTFNLSAEVPDSSVANVGTAQDPVAAMQPVLKWTVATPLKSISGQSTYYVQGDGLFKELSGPFARDCQDSVAKALDKALEYPLD